ncbi:MAG: hypothetical protein PHF46_04175 [Candidatus Gracilibacteria bacterium]|nr:hypothetical protein [Candidatus Gracilibacteria bacterium]MDD3120580.1 hypothetical protein [Candidatus Gracilibacteria bacterium]MDD4530217.1 hypothetical protein [Candidatus Gracilibacteria bacterium]
MKNSRVINFFKKRKNKKELTIMIFSLLMIIGIVCIGIYFLINIDIDKVDKRMKLSQEDETIFNVDGLKSSKESNIANLK